VGVRFFAYVQTGPGAHPASCTMGTGSFPGVKRPGRGSDHPPPSSAEVKKEESYTSTPLWAFGYVTGYLYLYLYSMFTEFSILYIFGIQLCSHFSLLMLTGSRGSSGGIVTRLRDFIPFRGKSFFFLNAVLTDSAFAP
jgi:hypothetical protein